MSVEYRIVRSVGKVTWLNVYEEPITDFAEALAERNRYHGARIERREVGEWHDVEPKPND
jgi:hypothetical protein